MAENFNRDEPGENRVESEILVNDYGATRDSTVVVEEENRTVLLTDNETIIIEKEPRIDIVPKNRPRKVYAGMWGSAETATVGLGMLAVLSVIVLVVLVVLPAQKELERNKIERARLDAELMSARGKYGDITSTETRVAQLVGSAADFESNHLPSQLTGRTALYQRLNGLISAYGLINSTGPDYTPLEMPDAGDNSQNTESERGREKFKSVFPGVYVTATVEGSYQNLRRFIRDIETGDQFVIISAVELEPAENKGDDNRANGAQQQQQQAAVNSVRVDPQMQQMQQMSPNVQNFGSPGNGVPPMNGYQYPMSAPPMQQQMQSSVPQTVTRPVSPRGTTRGETVSLRLEMAAYFRRSSALQPTAAPDVQQ